MSLSAATYTQLKHDGLDRMHPFRFSPHRYTWSPPAFDPDLRVPSKTRMLPIQILNLLLTHTGQFRIHINLIPLFVIPLHVEQQDDTRDQDRRASRQVQAIADGVIRTIRRQERPRRYEAAHIATHYIHANACCTRGIRDKVRGDLCVSERPKGECAGGDDEGGAVSGLGIVLRGGEEHDVADHYERCADDEEDIAAVESP